MQAIPQYTYATFQTPTAQNTREIPGSSLQPPQHFTNQPTPRATSKPYILPNRLSPRPEGQAVGGVADADAEQAISQTARPRRQRAQSSPLRNASMPTLQNTEQPPSRSARRRSFQSIPVTNALRIQVLPFRNEDLSPYRNGQPPVHNTPLPFQNGLPRYQNVPSIQVTPPQFQNGHQYGLPYIQNSCFRNGWPYYQNGYFKNGSPYSQNGYFQNGQPFYQDDPFPIPNYPRPFDYGRLPSHQNGDPASIPHFEPRSRVADQPPTPSGQPAPTGPSAGNNPSFRPILNLQLAGPQAPQAPPAPRLSYRVPIALSTPVPHVPPFFSGHFIEDEKPSYLFSAPVGIMCHLYWTRRSANTLGL